MVKVVKDKSRDFLIIENQNGSERESRGCPKLTICIAAIAQDNREECIVFATDHMITFDIGGYDEARVLGKFEHSIKKYRIIGKNTVAMIAGIPLIFSDLVKGTENLRSYDSVKEKIFQNFQKIRDTIIQNEILDVFHLDNTFLGESIKSDSLNPITEKILEKVLDFKLNTAILLIGFDRSNRAVISEISEQSKIDVTDIHFNAIGSGYIQAINTLYFQKHTKEKDLKTAIYNVFKAKSNAEVHEGVGRETDLLILKRDGCLKLTKDSMDDLREIYNDELGFAPTHDKFIKLNLDEVCEKCS